MSLIAIPMRKKNSKTSERIDEDVLSLARKSRVADSILLSWGLTEVFIDRMILKLFAIDSLDKVGREFLTRRSFEAKVTFLLKKEILSVEEAKRIRAFQDERNSLFHTPKGGLLPLLKLEDRDSLKRLGINSARAAAFAFGRLLGNEAGEETREWVKNEVFEDE